MTAKGPKPNWQMIRHENGQVMAAQIKYGIPFGTLTKVQVKRGSHREMRPATVGDVWCWENSTVIYAVPTGFEEYPLDRVDVLKRMTFCGSCGKHNVWAMPDNDEYLCVDCRFS